MALIEERLKDLRQQGYCCSQSIVQLGLDVQGEANPTLIQAMGGLCNGLYAGRLCGALTGAACLLAMLEPEKAAAFMIADLQNWFVTEYGDVEGCIDCNSIIAGDPFNKFHVCPPLIAATASKAIQILEENGWEFSF